MKDILTLFTAKDIIWAGTETIDSWLKTIRFIPESGRWISWKSEMAIYLFLFFVGLGFLILTTLMGSLFGDHGDTGHGDGGVEADGSLEGLHLPSPFSPRSLAATATGFGAGGALALLNGGSGSPSLVFAIAGGLVVWGAVYGFLVWVVNQQRSSHIRRDDLIGRVGTVVTDISATGVGEVSILFGDQSSTYLARSAAGTSIARGHQVLVESLGGEVLFVRMLYG